MDMETFRDPGIEKVKGINGILLPRDNLSGWIISRNAAGAKHSDAGCQSNPLIYRYFLIKCIINELIIINKQVIYRARKLRVRRCAFKCEAKLELWQIT